MRRGQLLLAQAASDSGGKEVRCEVIRWQSAPAMCPECSLSVTWQPPLTLGTTFLQPPTREITLQASGLQQCADPLTHPPPGADLL